MRTKMPDVIEAYIQASMVEIQTGLGVCSQRMPSFTTRDRNIAALWRSGNGLHLQSRSTRLLSHRLIFRWRNTKPSSA